MNDEKGWRFPPTNGGEGDGLGHSGIAQFNGAPLSSLARETIQNSLDASGKTGEPVHIDFELIDLDTNKLGRDELSKAVASCIASCKEGRDDDAKVALTDAQEIITRDYIPCLRVSDRNTIGLRGDNWRALVKMRGVSQKENEGAGGSHGIGKYAPFAVSALRTVFYWTCYEEDGKQVEKFQGKSVLISHESEEGETQGTGFYGIKEGCRELTGPDIPKEFRLTYESKYPVRGTSLMIAGFNETRRWRERIATSVIENFFYAIDKGTLTVGIEPEGDVIEIDKASLGNWFAELLDDEEAQDDEDGSSLKQVRTFWEVSHRDISSVDKQDKDFGHCRLWIRVAEGLPSVVGFVRGTGMLVTTQQPGLLRFGGFRDFSALCVFEDPKGNELLRRMENPQHNKFEPDRLPEGEREQGRRALKRITDWIRNEIRKRALPTETGKSTELPELATVLPDLQPDEPFDDDVHADDEEAEQRNPSLGERVKLQLRPVRRRIPRPLPPGPRPKPTPVRKDKEAGISSVRILSISGRENCYGISFLSDVDGIARVELGEAGDSSVIPRNDIRLVADDASLANVQLVKGERTHLEVTADAPIGNRAWRIRAVLSEDDHQ